VAKRERRDGGMGGGGGGTELAWDGGDEMVRRRAGRGRRPWRRRVEAE
jgi:hypothetical protein